ncbi:MAG: chorismate mutase [Ilumatobacteraceae bacterium]|jgi:chorismate mutase/catechol 2,3-dioxygenase-like lactoylglutathione lyase family enzyme
MSDQDTAAALGALRLRIDALDREFIRIVADRLALCEEVAAVKERSNTAVVQPARVRDVVTSRRQLAIDAGVDPDFAEQLFRVLLAETHRIEVAGQRPDAAPDKVAAPDGIRSGLDTVATRIDHLVVAVEDLDAAVASFTGTFGFHPTELAGGDVLGIRALAAGGVTIVLVGAAASPAVATYLERNGGGIQHVAIEVLNAGYARASLVEADASLITDVVVDDAGHEQFFAARDARTGVQLGFISRTGHRVGVAAANVLALFDTLVDP